MKFDDVYEKFVFERKYALGNHIPIIRGKSAKFLFDYVKQNNIKTVLEIGTAIGFSGSLMLFAGVDELTTIDINPITNEIAAASP